MSHTEPDTVNPFLDAALAYAAAGIAVLPCEPSTKAPVGTLVPPDRSIKGRGYVVGSGGCKKASRDPATIRGWWSCRPDAMIGIATGAVSGIFVIDLDAPKQVKCGLLGTMTENGVENWKELGIAPDTFEVETPGGGRHIYFTYDKARPVSCKEGALNGRGINVRGDGGYVIAPPSQNVSGGVYRPSNGHAVTDAAEAPEALYAALGARRGGTRRDKKPAAPEATVSEPEAPETTGHGSRLGDFDDFSLPKTLENIELLRGALNAVSSDDRQTWFSILCALNTLEPTWGDAARRIAVWWSQKSVKFDMAGFLQAWNSLDPEREDGITVETIFYRARMNGWADPRPADRQRVKNPGPFPINTAAELEMKTFSRIKFAIPGFLVEGATILAGRPKIGKSWLALDWALAVADEKHVFNGIRCKQGDVLYIALEDGERRLQDRIRTVLGRPDGWPPRLHYATAWPRADEGGLGKIREWVTAHPETRLVVVDILENFRPHERGRNVYAADYVAGKELQKLASELRIAVLIVHHVKKGAAESHVEKISGTYGLAGAVDAYLVLDGKSPETITLAGSGRDIVEVDLSATFNSGTCRWEIKGNRIEVQRSAGRDVILKVLKAAAVTLSPVMIAEATDMPRVNVRRLLAKMVDDGEVLRGETALYVHPLNAVLLKTIPMKRGFTSTFSV